MALSDDLRKRVVEAVVLRMGCRATRRPGFSSQHRERRALGRSNSRRRGRFRPSPLVAIAAPGGSKPITIISWA